ncbi:MAG: class D sortase [Heyndrickxia sp.]
MKRKNTKIILFVSILVIVLGVGFSTSNIFKLAKGYTLYKIHKAYAVSPKTEKPVEKNLKQKELYPVRPKTGENFGELYIPKLDATLPIFEGADENQLAKGVGHYAGSVLPGEKDNSVLAGHRDTVFRKLGEVGKGDLLVVRTAAGEFTYKISKVRIVDKDDRTVIVPRPTATLTVATCYPFNFIGQAPKRYILVGYLLSSKPAQ